MVVRRQGGARGELPGWWPEASPCQVSKGRARPGLSQAGSRLWGWLKAVLWPSECLNRNDVTSQADGPLRSSLWVWNRNPAKGWGEREPPPVSRRGDCSGLGLMVGFGAEMTGITTIHLFFLSRAYWGSLGMEPSSVPSAPWFWLAPVTECQRGDGNHLWAEVGKRESARSTPPLLSCLLPEGVDSEDGVSA